IMKTVRLEARLDPEDAALLRSLADQDGLSISDMIRVLLRQEEWRRAEILRNRKYVELLTDIEKQYPTMPENERWQLAKARAEAFVESAFKRGASRKKK